MPIKADVKDAGDQVVSGGDTVWAWIPGDTITITDTVGITDVVSTIIAICKEFIGNSILAILFARKSRVNTEIDKEPGKFDTDISKTSKIG